MKYILKAYCISEFGQRRDSSGNPHQEDSIFPLAEQLSDDCRTFILCDGMGGHEAGEVASATVCEAMGNIVSGLDKNSNGFFTVEDFEVALAGAFDALDKKDNGAPKKMGTTMTFLKLHENGATIAHIGDSRVYHIRPGKEGKDTTILFETEDHSLVNDLIKVGELTRKEARLSSQKNIITRAMQPNMDRRPVADIHEISDIKAGDYFYMCSDGMLEQPEMENGESLRNIFSEKGGNDENKINILRTVTEDNRDNHTAFVIHILDVEQDLPDNSAPIQATSGKKTVLNGSAIPVIKDDRFYDSLDHPDESNENLSSGSEDKPRKGNAKGKISLNKFVVIFFAIFTVACLWFLFKPDSKSKESEEVKLEERQEQYEEEYDGYFESHSESGKSNDQEVRAKEKAAARVATEVIENGRKVEKETRHDNNRVSVDGKSSSSEPAPDKSPERESVTAPNTPPVSNTAKENILSVQQKVNAQINSSEKVLESDQDKEENKRNRKQ